MIWFIADTHFGHEKIIEYCNRPFSDVSEMNETMISRWNQCVAPGDTIYHLGDFAFKIRVAQVNRIVARLNGHKHLIYGNHDWKAVQHSEGWAWKGHYKRITVEDQRIILFHYAMRVWHGSHRGAWHLYGHSHGSLPPDYSVKAFDVGVDCFNFEPVSLDKVSEIMRVHGSVPVDHHRPDEDNHD